MLIRQASEGTKASTRIPLLDKLKLGENEVAYSLNKKGRWKIPILLKNLILCDSVALGDATVTMVESHKLKKQSRTISYCSTGGEITQVVPKKSRTYFNVQSIPNYRKKETPATQGNQSATDATQSNEQLVPNVTVNVVYPCPGSSSIIHNPKYIRFSGTVKEPEDENTPTESIESTNFTKTKSKRNRNKFLLKGSSKAILSEYEDEYYDDAEDDEFEAENSEETYNRDNNNDHLYSLEDILECTQRMQTMYKDSVLNTKYIQANEKSNNKGKLVYVEQPQQPKQAESKTQKVEKITYAIPFQPMRVNIPSENVQPDYLKHVFGNKYTECPCSPRKFVIDITRQVTRQLNACKLLGAATDTSALLVFVYDIYRGLEWTNGEEPFALYLNMNVGMTDMRLETLFDDATYTVEDIINRVASFTTTISREHFNERTGDAEVHNVSLIRKHQTTFQLIQRVLKTKTTSTTLNDYKSDLEAIQQLKSSQESQTSVTDGFPPESCPICFECMVGCSATAQQACGHWFCDTCWREHVENTSFFGQREPSCPEYGCKQPINLLCLINAISLEGIRKVVVMQATNEIEMDQNTKWCPNTKCGRVLKVDVASETMNVACMCGQDVCFDCLQPAHWPITCEQTTSYLKELKKKGELIAALPDPTLIHGINGKKCPDCRRFVEKMGGCFFMACVCGGRFCWGCGKSFRDHDPDKNCYPTSRRKNLDLFKTKYRIFDYDVLLKSTNSPSSNGFKAAVQNRKKRYGENVRHINVDISPLAVKLEALLRRRNSNIGKMLTSHGLQHEDDILNTFRVRPFLTNMVNIYLELLHIAEHTWIFAREHENINRMRISKSQLQDIVMKIESISEQIAFILTKGTEQDLQKVIPNLWKCRVESEKCITALVKGLKPLKRLS